MGTWAVRLLYWVARIGKVSEGREIGAELCRLTAGQNTI